MAYREDLGDFMSIVCFKAVITGMEDILGPEGTASALIAAGRARGATVARSAGLENKNSPVETLAEIMNQNFGKEGTRLCTIKEVLPTEDGFVVKTSETVCTAAEPAGSNRICTYTLGAIMGFLETVTGTTMLGKHTANILQGSPTDDFTFRRM